MRCFAMVLMLGLVALMAGALVADDGMPLWAYGYNAPPPPGGSANACHGPDLKGLGPVPALLTSRELPLIQATQG